MKTGVVAHTILAMLTGSDAGPGRLRHNLLNAVLFQVAWPLCVLGGSAVAALTTFFVLLVHLLMAGNRRLELAFILGTGIIGLLCDVLLLATGVLISPQGMLLPPLWLSCLWLLFASTVGYSLRWFHQHLLVAALFAGLFAPLSYVAGTRLTELDLMAPTGWAVFWVGLCWALVFPALILFYRRVETWPWVSGK